VEKRLSKGCYCTGLEDLGVKETLPNVGSSKPCKPTMGSAPPLRAATHNMVISGG